MPIQNRITHGLLMTICLKEKNSFLNWRERNILFVQLFGEYFETTSFRFMLLFVVVHFYFDITLVQCSSTNIT